MPILHIGQQRAVNIETVPAEVAHLLWQLSRIHTLVLFSAAIAGAPPAEPAPYSTHAVPIADSVHVPHHTDVTKQTLPAPFVVCMLHAIAAPKQVRLGMPYIVLSTLSTGAPDAKCLAFAAREMHATVFDNDHDTALP